MKRSIEIEKRIRNVFTRVFKKKSDSGNIKAKEAEEWNSLTHIELIIALEEEFEIEIDPDSILKLFSDLDTIVHFLDEALGDDT